MKKYAKIVCGTIQIPQNYPCSIVVDGKTVYNPTEAQLQAVGYLPLDETPEPVAEEGKIAVATYTVSENGTAIEQRWHFEDAPTEEPHTDEEPAPESVEGE